MKCEAGKDQATDIFILLFYIQANPSEEGLSLTFLMIKITWTTHELCLALLLRLLVVEPSHQGSCSQLGTIPVLFLTNLSTNQCNRKFFVYQLDRESKGINKIDSAPILGV